ncbi:hypothetical protein O6H91_03G133900 [Diphasiastrum complanatum]|uniref:Uncharacterized protein n=9 Tax=Diphasiastrum complanatum TaxID=34168 RepID=A0ACC2EBZ4_DIPCM|nr:hypothetical protein O6H91_03G133900 [Diphasiastrum complanatum]KAJ7564009.1 hypothetical protein O6H91_03G133900 [Diphasiastrum complanatum]KAJ7564011.1 hypothetical protein O6H91_03G133900 [Diphasiastrum complanatum]KAJ7564012.1 hypothetical protein O6H91_03G133900 [Diphasiastrum complanatum]KAJ7564015.1 hypothetical protein O6H91_03G133900 [Diphasiastrum complanatum]
MVGGMTATLLTHNLFNPNFSSNYSARDLRDSFVSTRSTKCRQIAPLACSARNCQADSTEGVSLSRRIGRKLTNLSAGVGGGLIVNTIVSLAGDGGGMGGWVSGGGGGGGGDENSWQFWSQVGVALAEGGTDDDSVEPSDPHGLKVGLTVPVNKLNPTKRYKLSGVELTDRRTDQGIDMKDPFYELVTIRSGGVFTKAQLEAEVENLKNCGMFETVEMVARTQADGSLKIQVPFVESQWQSANLVRCVNVGLLPQSRPPEVEGALNERERDDFVKFQEEQYKARLNQARPCLLPKSVEREIAGWLRSETRVTARMLQRIRDRVQKWYHDEGYACAQVVNFGNLNTKEIVCEVIEGDITKVQIQFQDKMGNSCEGNTRLEIIARELPEQLRAGQLFNIEAGKKALRNVNNLALFSNIEVNPRPDEEADGGIVVEVKLKELEQKTAEVSTEWNIVPGSSGRPSLASIQPGGSVTFEHRNLKGLNRSILCCVTSNNLLNPQDDLGFKMEYVHPYLDGVRNPRDRTFKASCFNSRKLSAVFTGGPGLEEVPAIWVDRAGFKANITENFTRQSKLTYGLVLEEVTTRDENSSICTNGARILPSGAVSMDGPPTTLSDTGIDHVGFFQANITQDNTKFVNGTPVGTRNIFQLDQGLGIGSKFPFFNRHQLTMTRFIQLKAEERGSEKPPPVAVLHGRYGGCVGDLPSYDAFTLGGPYSVRGYNMGELAACRNLLELAAELRVPIRNTHYYGFVEYGTDLGSSKDVKGNPTEFFRRMGHGASYGFGVKLGLVRAEYARDCNAGTGSVFVRFGERF